MCRLMEYGTWLANYPRGTGPASSVNFKTLNTGLQKSLKERVTESLFSTCEEETGRKDQPQYRRWWHLSNPCGEGISASSTFDSSQRESR